MSRLNGRQKRAAKRALALTLLAKSRNASSQVDVGFVRSSHKAHIIRDNQLLVGANPGMRENSVNTPPKRGKVVKGNFKPVNPLTKGRFSAK